MIDISASSTSCVLLYVMHTYVLVSPFTWLLLLLLIALAPQQVRPSAYGGNVNEGGSSWQQYQYRYQHQHIPGSRSVLRSDCSESTIGNKSKLTRKAQHGALASVCRLSSGAHGVQHRVTLAFSSSIRDRWFGRNKVDSSDGGHNGNTGGSASITTAGQLASGDMHKSSGAYSGLMFLLHSIARALKRGGAAVGITGGSTASAMRHGSSAVSSPTVAIIVGLACALSIAAANTLHIAPKPLAMRGTRGSKTVVGSTAVATVHPPGVESLEIEEAIDEENGGSISLSRRVGCWRARRKQRAAARVGKLSRKILLKSPRFPLAYASWWKALKEHRKRGALSVAEGLEAEDHEVTQRAEGAQIFRSAQFWGRSATIYLSYKKMQARCALELPRIANEGEREQKRREYWDGIHELNSDRMLKLCLDLRGFYLKSGQFLGTRHDFMPKIFLKKLGKLHDDVPPMPARKVSEVLQKELDSPPNEIFASLNLTHPVGSASISQVHRGVLRETGEKVAVKVQYPGAERVMMSDLRNLKTLAWFLQKFELNFDILSSLRELSKQIKGEFDFRAEAKTLDRMHGSLEQQFARITVPESRLSTKRLLIMSYVEGESLAQLKRGGKERFKAARKRIGKGLLHELADAWGYMIFSEGLFNADPHPGNILIIPEERVGPIKRVFGLIGLRTPKLRIGLLDWGQIKELGRSDREKVANLILAVSNRQSEDIVTCFNRLGVKLSNPDDADSIEKLALVMFDTRTIKGLDFNPFSSNNVLKLNAVHEYPQDLYFILRTVLMFRGMAQSLGVEFSLADFWAPHASRLLASPPLPPAL